MADAEAGMTVAGATAGTVAGAAPGPAIGRGLAAAIVGALGWGVLSAGDPASLVVGLPTVLLAAVVAARVGRAGAGGSASRGATGSFALIRFLLRLLGDIFGSATPLALQVFRPRLDLDPGVIRHPLALGSAEARAAFTNAVTLTPGTLAADLAGQMLRVHALDRRGGTAAELAALEARVAALYGEPGGGAPGGTAG